MRLVRVSSRSLALALWLGILAGSAASAAQPADEVLGLVPADATATLLVEDLRGQTRTILDSQLFRDFRSLAPVREWFASDRYQQLERARLDIERVVGANLTELRDNLLGDAVALTLRLGADGDPEQAQGMLVTLVRDGEKLRRLISSINTLERDQGRLLRVDRRARREVEYFVRVYKEGTKPDEAYLILGGRLFAWSNTPAMLERAIDCHLDRRGLATDQRFLSARASLGDHPLVSCYMDPRAVERLDPFRKASGPTAAAVIRLLQAMTFAGASLEWRDGLVVRVHEAFDPARLPWRKSPEEVRPVAGLGGLDRIPPSAPVLVVASLDFVALDRLLVALTPEDDKARLDTALVALRGLLLGNDVRGRILPRLGPTAIAFLDAPDERLRFPLTLALGFQGTEAERREAARSVNNALHTVFALAALDHEADGGRRRLEERPDAGIHVVTLQGIPSPLSFSVGPDFLALGTDATAVAAFLRGPSDTAPNALLELRPRFFPGSGTFACANTERLLSLAESNRAPLLRWLSSHRDTKEAVRDLDQALGLLGLFRAVFVAGSVDPDLRAAHQVFGLLERQPKLASPR